MYVSGPGPRPGPGPAYWRIVTQPSAAAALSRHCSPAPDMQARLTMFEMQTCTQLSTSHSNCLISHFYEPHLARVKCALEMCRVVSICSLHSWPVRAFYSQHCVTLLTCLPCKALVHCIHCSRQHCRCRGSIHLARCICCICSIKHRAGSLVSLDHSLHAAAACSSLQPAVCLYWPYSTFIADSIGHKLMKDETLS